MHVLHHIQWGSRRLTPAEVRARSGTKWTADTRRMVSFFREVVADVTFHNEPTLCIFNSTSSKLPPSLIGHISENQVLLLSHKPILANDNPMATLRTVTLHTQAMVLALKFYLQKRLFPTHPDLATASGILPFAFLFQALLCILFPFSFSLHGPPRTPISPCPSRGTALHLLLHTCSQLKFRLSLTFPLKPSLLSDTVFLYQSAPLARDPCSFRPHQYSHYLVALYAVAGDTTRTNIRNSLISLLALDMNMALLPAEGDNQQRMFEALRHMSEEVREASQVKFSSLAMPAQDTFFSDPNILPPSDYPPAAIQDGPTVPNDCLSIDFEDHSESALSFEPMNHVNDQPLQVDHNGTKVGEHSPASAWVPSSVFSDIPRSVSMSTTSSMGHYSPRSTGNASVFAAAITAAMIVEHPDAVPKRPRPPPSESFDDDYLGDDDTDGHNVDIADDNTTEASLELDIASPELELSPVMNSSPRSIITSVKEPEIIRAVPEIRSESQLLAPRRVTEPRPRSAMLSQAQTVPQPEPVLSTRKTTQETAAFLPQFLDMSRNALLSKKRRAEAMERFRRKKAVRCYGRRVRYQIRKRIATTRPRVNGRFARRADTEQQKPVKSASHE